MTSIVDALKPCRKHCLSLSPWLTSKYRRIRFETLSLKVGVILALKDVVGLCRALCGGVWRCGALYGGVWRCGTLCAVLGMLQTLEFV